MKRFRFMRRISVVLKRGWRNANGLATMETLGMIIIGASILALYFGVILRDPFVDVVVKLYWGGFIGGIFLFLFYSITRYA